jgi:hypothetical protein
VLIEDLDSMVSLLFDRIFTRVMERASNTLSMHQHRGKKARQSRVLKRS